MASGRESVRPGGSTSGGSRTERLRTSLLPSVGGSGRSQTQGKHPSGGGGGVGGAGWWRLEARPTVRIPVHGWRLMRGDLPSDQELGSVVPGRPVNGGPIEGGREWEAAADGRALRGAAPAPPQGTAGGDSRSWTTSLSFLCLGTVTVRRFGLDILVLNLSLTGRRQACPHPV